MAHYLLSLDYAIFSSCWSITKCNRHALLATTGYRDSWIEKAGLVGRGGGSFPVHRKWKALLDAKGDEKFVICNASEGEPSVKKDWELLLNHTEQVFEGMLLACKFAGAKKCWMNCNHEYLHKLKKQLDTQVIRLKKHGIECILFEEKKDSYLGGESSTILNVIEGKKEIPRNKKFRATDYGLWGKPTLINNVETFYDVAAVASGTFDHTRLYTISGAVKNAGVFRLPAEKTVQEVLEQTGNEALPKSFVQIGGGACGEVKRGNDLGKPATGVGSIEVFDMQTTPKDILLRCLEFFQKNLCGTCTPCRDGVPQLLRLVKENKTLPWEEMLEITAVQKATAFCALGRSIDDPVRSLYEALQK